MTSRPPLHHCKTCNGTGKVFDDLQLGTWFRQAREDCYITLNEMSRRISYDPSYLSLLERGKAHWTLDMERKYVLILGISPR